MKTIKRRYHPLVMYGFYTGLLKADQLKLIPNSTLSYWRSFDHKEYFGYEWVSDYIETDIQMKDVAKRKVGITVIRFVGRMYKCYDQLLADTKSFKRVIKRNSAIVVATIDKLNSYIKNLHLSCKLIKISVTQYYRLKNKINCSASVLNLCYKTHPAQLSVLEATLIKDTITSPENRNRPLSSLYYELMRAGKLFCSLTTLYKYAAILFPGKKHPRKIIKYDSFKATKPFEYLHIDTTFMPSEEEGDIPVAFVKDNFSTAILGWSILPDRKSIHIRDLLNDTFQKFDLNMLLEPIHIVSDGGSENKGDVTEWVNNPENNHVTKLTAKLDFHYSNSMSESSFNDFKNNFMRDKTTRNRKHLFQQCSEYHLYCNDRRYPVKLYGLTPNEVLRGAVPHRDLFKYQIVEAQKSRYIVNKKGSFCEICQ